MLEIAIMIEGQDGINWPRWQRLARAVEDLGFAGLYRSDHFTNPNPPDLDSLELWVSLTWLASHTHRIEFGSLVSPVSFRDPVVTARTAAQVSELSGGRLRLGIGAGWQEREHHLFGYDLLETGPRFRRFREGLDVITALLRSSEPVTYAGEFYRLNGASLHPRQTRVPIVIGGNGERLTLPLAARYADEWNAVFQPPARLVELNRKLDELLIEAGRAPGDVRRTMMTNLVYGRSAAELSAQLHGRDAADLAARGVICGEPAQVKEQLARLAEVGLKRVMLQWLAPDDLDRLESFAKEVL